MTDVEGSTQRQQQPRPVENPYADDMPQNRALEKLKRLLYMAISHFGLDYFKFYGVILRSPHVRHEWFKVGLAATIGTLNAHEHRWLLISTLM